MWRWRSAELTAGNFDDFGWAEFLFPVPTIGVQGGSFLSVNPVIETGNLVGNDQVGGIRGVVAEEHGNLGLVIFLGQVGVLHEFPRDWEGGIKGQVRIRAAPRAEPPPGAEMGSLVAFVIKEEAAGRELGLVALTKKFIVPVCIHFWSGEASGMDQTGRDFVFFQGQRPGKMMGTVIPRGVGDADASQVERKGQGVKPFEKLLPIGLVSAKGF